LAVLEFVECPLMTTLLAVPDVAAWKADPVLVLPLMTILVLEALLLPTRNVPDATAAVRICLRPE
jgi:hypothetical protein